MFCSAKVKQNFEFAKFAGWIERSNCKNRDKNSVALYYLYFTERKNGFAPVNISSSTLPNGSCETIFIVEVGDVRSTRNRCWQLLREKFGLLRPPLNEVAGEVTT